MTRRARLWVYASAWWAWGIVAAAVGWPLVAQCAGTIATGFGVFAVLAGRRASI